ncbi:MAG: hypothetical protein ACE5OT_02285 [Candidatus Hadarchaeaceae archaeon]
MDQHGLLADFLVCKIGVAFAALTLLGAVLTMSSGFKRTAEREDLAILADTIAGAIRTVERMPGEVELRKALPALAHQSEVVITGEFSEGTQIIHIVIDSGELVERTLMLNHEVNGGEFSLSLESPTVIRLSKAGEIRLELI